MTVRKIPTILVALSISIWVLLVSDLGPVQVTPRRIEIVAKRFDFSPIESTLKKGVPVTLSLKSEDYDHGIKIRELNFPAERKEG
jgi:cytochrome c oxidase subunit 2